MNSSKLIAIVAGLVSAVLYYTATSSVSALSLLLSFLTSLPIVITILGWGLIEGILAGVIGTITLALLSSAPLEIGGFYFLSQVVPYLVLSWLAHQYRITDSSQETQSIEWYPVGRLILWGTVFAGCLASLKIVTLGTDYTAYQSRATEMFNLLLKEMQKAEGFSATEQQIQVVRSNFLTYLPGLAGIAWFVLLMLNFWLGAIIVDKSERLSRPWPEFRSMDYPPVFITGFLLVCLTSYFTSGFLGVFATAFAGPMFLAYFLLGLAVIHTVTANFQFRSFALIFVYLSVLRLMPVSILIAILGVGESIFKLRQRALSSQSNDKPDED